MHWLTAFKTRTKMKTATFFILTAIAFISGCSHLEYIGNTNKVKTMDSIEGFTISPSEAEKIVSSIKGHRRSAKYDFYRDDTFYYAIGSFTGSYASQAEKDGIKIHGNSGDFYNPQTKMWVSKPVLKIRR
ncbi:MAG: hypothetical protein PF904_16430 [Kiritimatiellae bacterium]|jgi:hypothetical protein|nr:hypothetical protein [Kiritimatiellia bacterium]